MPIKVAAKKVKKIVARKAAGKTTQKAAKKKTTSKKAVIKKPVKKKSAATSKMPKKKAAAKRKPAQLITAQKKPMSFTISAKDQTVKPGPQPVGIPSVEEPAVLEEAIGVVTHYYSHLGVAVVQLNKGTLKRKNMIHIKGHITDLVQKIESMQYEHQYVDQASAGQSVGLKTQDHVREHDIVYLIK